MATKQQQQQQRQEIAKALDCFTSEDLRALAGITESTEEAWRKRHKGPPYVLLGTQYLYPRKGVAEYLQALVRAPDRVPAKTML